MIYLFKASERQYFVTEGLSLEEALIKAFNRGISVIDPQCPRSETNLGLEIIECPEHLVSTPETRELLYGI